MIRVLIVDDSNVFRSVVRRALVAEGDIEVVGEAADPYEARDLVVRLRPDVVTLDLEMPRMDGLTFLQKLMAYFPVPVVLLSGGAERGSEAAVRALILGAVDVVPKPGGGDGASAQLGELARAVRSASNARVTKRSLGASTSVIPRASASLRLLLIGASTGGTRAIASVLAKLPRACPPTLIVQHMPKAFTGSFAQHLDEVTPLTVREAEGGEVLMPGQAFVAPGDRHLTVRRSGGQLTAVLCDGGLVRHHRPSVDVLFHSAVQAHVPGVSAALLTGMGDDGARGLLALREAGARTIAEAKETAVVHGMPGAAVKLGAPQFVVPLPSVASTLLGARAGGAA